MFKLLTRSLVGMSLLVLSAATHADVAPLPAAWQIALAKVEHDPPPPALAADAHFVISDGRAHWTFHDAVQGLGGVLLGVGTDPNYLFAGWMKAELVLLVDFDQVVADIHGLYGVAFRHSTDVDTFLALWSPKKQSEFSKFIDADAPDAATRKRWQAALKLARNAVYDKWLFVKKDFKARGVSSLLSDPAQFAHVKQLVENKRVWAWRGDLTANKTMMGIQAALQAIGQPLSVFYITNAEKYFPYAPQARKNLRDLPYAEKSVVLRTQGRPDKPDQIADHHYSYYTQDGKDFAAWLRQPIGNVHPICHRRKATKTQGFFTLPGAPAPKTAKPRKGK